MTIPILIDCDPGNGDAIALLALESPQVELLGVKTEAGDQMLDKTTANALRVLERVSRDGVSVAVGADRPPAGELVVAADAHGESGSGGSTLPPPHRRPLDQHAIDFLAEQVAGRIAP